MQFEPVIGLEVHAELETRSKMFCACPVVDPLMAKPNTAVCPICAGMPGVLPVINQRAVEYAVRVALALDCKINLTSIFARKNYFYPDLPKGYQISQYEQPLARHGRLLIQTTRGEKLIRIRRVHIEEDTGKLTHISQEGQSFSLVDLNRAGNPLLEIVTEPDMHSAEEVRLYAQALRALLRYLGVNSGDMQKGILRIEPNVSVRRVGSETLGTRVEVKNLNSFRALERSVDYEIERQSEIIRKGGAVRQETLGWDAAREATFTQRVKEGEEDYRYFPEPDLPPLVLDPAWIEEIRHSLPELPAARQRRFQEDYHLSAYDAGLLVNEQAAADYYEQTLRSGSELPAKLTANWISGELFALLNQSRQEISVCPVSPAAMAGLLHAILGGSINQTTAKTVLGEMFVTGQSAEFIIASRGLQLITDTEFISDLVARTLAENPEQVAAYLKGKETISHWLFGQVMRQVQGQANAQLIHSELDRQLNEIRRSLGNA
jgi:aspartyl-tRNA(Asn)/glutamyl-tRNA(Gln) amidotransferase subunit B